MSNRTISTWFPAFEFKFVADGCRLEVFQKYFERFSKSPRITGYRQAVGLREDVCRAKRENNNIYRLPVLILPVPTFGFWSLLPGWCQHRRFSTLPLASKLFSWLHLIF
jgi:hypothetical protein